MNSLFGISDPKLPDPARDHPMRASDLLTQTMFAAFLGGSVFAAFCLLRFRWPDVYAPRGRLLYAAPARMGKTLLGWITMTLKAKDFDIMYSAGLDALLVLRLFKMLGMLALASAVIGLGMVVPLKVLVPEQAESAKPTVSDASWYDRITNAVMGSKHPLVIHFAFAYVFTALVYYYFGRFAYQALALRWHYLLRVRNTRPARSIMITGIPTELEAEGALKQHFERAGFGTVVSVEIVPRISRLGVLVRRRARLLLEIEEQVAELLGNPCQHSDYDRDHLLHLLLDVDETEDTRIEACRLLQLWALPKFTSSARRARKLESRLEKLQVLLRHFHHSDSVITRVRQEWFSSYDGLSDRSSTVGFVTFADSASAHSAAQAFTCSQPFQLRTELAPEARNVYWDNITMPLSSRLPRKVLVLGAYGLMLVYWLTIAILLSTLVSPKSLKWLFPRLPGLVEKNRWLRGFFEYTIPTFILSLMNASIPYILNWLASLSGIQSRSDIQRSVLQRYFFFVIANVLLTFTVSGTVLADYEKWVENPALIPKLFATNLPRIAPFFMNYIILYGLGYYPIQLLQLGSISLAVFRRLVCRTPRQFANALRPNYIDWSFILPQPMLVFVIMATYSSLAPLVCLFAAVYYLIAYLVTKYLVYYVYTRQFETAGEFIIPVLKLLTGSLWHYYCLIIGLCALHGAIGYVILLLPLLWMNAYLLSDVSRQFYENAKYVPLDLLNSIGATSSSTNILQRPPVPQGSQETNEDEDVQPSHTTSTDYLLPRPHVPTPFGALLDAVDSEYRGSFSAMWEKTQTFLHRLAAYLFSKIYIDPQLTPETFRDLDRCYSINNPASSVEEEEENTVSPRFSATFEETTAGSNVVMRAELMLGRDQRESKIEPDQYTDFTQSPISLLDGVLDEGLAIYEHPYLVGYLPQLWLPMKQS